MSHLVKVVQLREDYYNKKQLGLGCLVTELTVQFFFGEEKESCLQLIWNIYKTHQRTDKCYKLPVSYQEILFQ